MSRRKHANFDVRAAMRTFAEGAGWEMAPDGALRMLEDAFMAGGFCAFHALTDTNLDPIARLSIISQLSKQFDDYIEKRNNQIKVGP